MWLVAIPLALAVVLVGALWLLQDRMIFPAPGGPPPSPGDGLALERIETPDREELAALWHPPQPGEATVLFLHGNASTLERVKPIGAAWIAQGFGFLAPAWRGYPGSTGSPSEAGLLLDAEAAHDWAASLAGGPIVVYGQSLGSGPAVHVAAEREVAALVLEAPYDSVLAVSSARFPFVPVAPLLRHPFRSDERIGRVAEPILIVHGTADGVIPIAHGRALHALAPEGARFVEVDGATHFDIGARAFADALAFAREAVSNGARAE